MKIFVIKNTGKVTCKLCGRVHKYFTKGHRVLVVGKDFAPLSGTEIKELEISKFHIVADLYKGIKLSINKAGGEMIEYSTGNIKCN